MLDKLVRPLVRSQIQVLAGTKAASGKLVGTISRWLGYLGVHAEVTQLQVAGDRIQVSLSVAKPEQCTEDEWRQILANLDASGGALPTNGDLTYAMMTKPQRSKAMRLLAHVIQAGSPNAIADWERLQPELATLGIDAELLQGIRVALKVPQPLEPLLDGIDPEVVAFVLSRAIGIALLDKEINLDENNALASLYSTLGGSFDK